MTQKGYMPLNFFQITQPDDFHLHLRDGAALLRTVADTAKQFGRAIIMPNLKPPVTTIEAARAYQMRIIQAIPQGLDFTPFMTLYLTDAMTRETIQKASQTSFIKGIKWYPKGATTHSEAGVENIETLFPILSEMEKYHIPLLIHGEVTNSECDIFEREKIFIDRTLTTITNHFPDLKIVLEHISTKEAVEFIENASSSIAATITPHHLLLNRNDLLAGGLRPHHYCLPILKHRHHQVALIKAATSGNPKFFAGTDSAPHLQKLKESACGCAGIYSAFSAIEIYAEIFESAGSLEKLEPFVSHFGAFFYGLPMNTKKLTLSKTTWTVPETLSFEQEKIIPLKAGEQLLWKAFLSQESL